MDTYDISAVTTNGNPEPYAKQRDERVAALLKSKGIPLRAFNDITLFGYDEILKDDGKSYTVYTPYARKGHTFFDVEIEVPYPSEMHFHRLWKARPLPVPGSLSVVSAPT